MHNVVVRRKAGAERRPPPARLCEEAPTAPVGSGRTEEEQSMNLVVWLPAMFVLGLVSIGVCYAFVFACEEI